MTKKIALLMLSIISIYSTDAYSWRIEIPNPFGPPVDLKGKDLKVVVDITEGTKHFGKNITKEVANIIEYVGKTTGIKNIIESNRSTFSNIGTTKACLVTLCYSEVIKKRELEEQRIKLEKKMIADLGNLAKSYEIQEQKDILKHLTESKNALEKYKELLVRTESLIHDEKNIVIATANVIETQIRWRKSIFEHGLKTLPELKNLDVQEFVNNFENNLPQEPQEALDKLNYDLEILEIQIKRSKYELLAEAIYLLNDKTLELLRSITHQAKIFIIKEQAQIEYQLIEVDLNLSSINLQIENIGQ